MYIKSYMIYDFCSKLCVLFEFLKKIYKKSLTLSKIRSNKEDPRKSVYAFMNLILNSDIRPNADPFIIEEHPKSILNNII